MYLDWVVINYQNETDVMEARKKAVLDGLYSVQSYVSFLEGRWIPAYLDADDQIHHGDLIW